MENKVLTEKTKSKKVKFKRSEWSAKTAEEKLEIFASMLDKSILSYSHLARRSFLSGIFAGLGATVGVTLIFILVLTLLNWLGGVPFIGDLLHINDLVRQIQQLKK